MLHAPFDDSAAVIVANAECEKQIANLGVHADEAVLDAQIAAAGNGNSGIGHR